MSKENKDMGACQASPATALSSPSAIEPTASSRPDGLQSAGAGSHEFYSFALALLRAQQRMLDRWSEGDEAVRQQLWRDLHQCGDDLLLAASPCRPTGAGFTPGPWWVEDRLKVCANRGGGALQIQAQHRGEGSSYCVATVNFWEATEANARLIAAAPQLYAALVPFASRAFCDCDRLGNVDDCEFCCARAALAKATGNA
jgi:hypothetical protein